MGISVFILEAVVVSLALLAGFGVVHGPGLLRVALSFFALFVIPGAALERLLFARRTPFPGRWSRVFALGLIFSSAVVCAGFIPGVSYPAISVLASVLAVLLAFLARERGGERGVGGKRVRDGAFVMVDGVRSAVFAAVLFATCVLVFSGTGELGWNTDGPDHVSFVRRSVESGRLCPRDSFYREGDGVSPDPRKGLWHPVLSLWTYQAHEPADRVWRDAPAFLAFFAMATFLIFALELSGSRLCAWLALALLLLLSGGEGARWLTKLGFSKNVAQVAFWETIALLLAYYRSRDVRVLLVASLLACAATAFHVVVALLLATAALGLFFAVTFLRSAAAWRGPFWRSVPAIAGAAAVPLLLRAGEAGASANMIHTHMQGMLVFGRNLATVDPAELATRYGLVFFFALFVTPFFFVLSRRTERRGLVFVLFLVPVILVLDPLIASFMERRVAYLYYRLLDAAPTMVLVSLAVAGLCALLLSGRPGGESRARRPRSPAGAVAARLLAAVCLALFVFYPLRTALSPLRSSVRDFVEKPDPAPPGFRELFAALAEKVPRGSVIASDPVTSYLVSAYTDDFVTVVLDQHCSPTDTGAVDRLREARNLMSPSVPLEESRAWLLRERVDCVLVDLDPVGEDFFRTFPRGEAGEAYAKLRACPSLLSEVLAVDRFRLFRVHADSLADRREDRGCLASRRPLSCEAGEGGGADAPAGTGVLAGAGIDVGCGIVLVNLTVDNETLSPGDTLRGHLCWTAADTVRFGLPLEAAVRIETSFPKGAWYRPWYGKQYRRILERRTHRFYRLTWRLRLASGFAGPDLWRPGTAVRQDFTVALSPFLAPGAYELRVKVTRASYLPSRTVFDYLSNDDSLEGVPVGMIYIQGPVGSRGTALPVDGGLADGGR
jgi:hypothetical protein